MHTTVITVDTLNQCLDNPDWIIIDCRYDLMDGSAGYRSYLGGHIRRAVYVDLKHDLSGPPVTDHGRHPMPIPERLNDLFSFLGIGHDHQVVAYYESFGSTAAGRKRAFRVTTLTAVCGSGRAGRGRAPLPPIPVWSRGPAARSRAVPP